MRAMVTGGAGFIGSHLVEALVNQGAKVSLLDNLVFGQLNRIHPQAVFHNVDIRSKKAKKLIEQEKPDVFFHLAAQTDVQQSILDPGYDGDVNILGTINLLEACREAHVGKVIFASTSAVYGNLQKMSLSESDPTAPISYYGLSKCTAESYFRLFHRLYGIPYTILRFSNVYGPGQTAKGEGGVVAVFCDRIQADRPITVHGDGEQTRDFIYVKDVVGALLAAVKRGDQETIQVSSSSKTSVNDLAATLSRIHGSPIDIVHTPSRKGDIKHSCLNNGKARHDLHWQPLVGLLEGLTETYNHSKKTE
ncbi:NAD-dependent epimerase/dehydratase family protein [Cohnella nanjingensis]|uniref:NAD-dependent epimerase/dehydratase family protein n=1 Tax=Cohnella nanjingensis TaxID=1387779 RepID=A0A7X0VEC3_9BACL|nr:NAD-dependent epimerase/dehydratase family protein [Cohnella nanjingensis]MBB6669399.1 NAD-dependent epimerase/dehydratase family protein [Cohnella nanjingensis]